MCLRGIPLQRDISEYQTIVMLFLRLGELIRGRENSSQNVQRCKLTECRDVHQKHTPEERHSLDKMCHI